MLYIKSIDRLGRNYEEIQRQWRILTKDKGKEFDNMTVKEFILRAMEYEPIPETTAQKILKRILILLGFGMQKELPESSQKAP